MPVSDDKNYEQICQDIRFTDDISFKLLGLVPFISGSGIIAVLLKRETLWSEAIYVISLLGASLTFLLFRWELRNIQVCRWLMERAAEVEKSDMKNEDGKGQFYRRSSPPLLLRTPFGKTETEKWIYSTSVFVWLLLPWMVGFSAVRNADSPLQPANLYVATIYTIIAAFIFILTVFSIRSKITTDPKGK